MSRRIGTLGRLDGVRAIATLGRLSTTIALKNAPIQARISHRKLLLTRLNEVSSLTINLTSELYLQPNSSVIPLLAIDQNHKPEMIVDLSVVDVLNIKLEDFPNA